MSYSLSDYKSQWFSNIPRDLLSGIVVALALIPEAIAFSTIAGVDPTVGLYASFCIAVTSAIFGGRPGMISAATGATALLMVGLVREHGLQYLLAATLLTGVIQIFAGVFKLAKVMRFVSKSVMTGFVNALAILIFMAQFPEFKGAQWPMLAMVAGSLAIIYLFPRLTKAIPSPLIAIIVLTVVAIVFQVDVRRVGDLGALPDSLPIFLLPQVPFNLETLWIILPYSLGIASVGLLESWLTAQILDEMTDTPSDKNQESKGQGLSNIVSGLFGGMAGCAMIGQSVINIKSGGRGRFSTLCAGVFLLIFIVVGKDWVKQIPMPALVGVMFFVCIGTFSWASFANLRTYPKSSTIVMLVTTLVVVFTHNLALGVFIGVLLSGLFFASKVGKDLKVIADWEGNTRLYRVKGQLFFASADHFAAQFLYQEKTPRVIIDVSEAHFWDLTAVTSLDRVVLKLRRNGSEVTLVGLNEASATLVDKLGIHDKPDAVSKMLH